MTIPNNIPTPPVPAPKPPAPPPVKTEKATRVAPSYTYENDLHNKTTVPREMVEALKGPGDALNLSSGKRLSEVRSKLDLNQPYVGVHYKKGEKATVEEVPNPDSPDGKWDPKEFMPRFVFDAEEDAFPVAPDFDGDQDLGNNGPVEANGKDGNYEDGVIGGDQPLSGAFSVTKKGEYTVLTYSFYSATNKAATYHANDYSTAQVYLKPGKDGKLEPTHLSTSWHHGSQITAWKDLKKDESGDPVVKVHRGSHALQPLGQDDDIPTEGVQIAGDGSVTQNGEALPHTLGFEAFQKNVSGATYKDPASPNSAARLEAMRWGDAALNPFLPEVYEDAKHPVLEMAERYIGPVVDKAVDKVENAAEEVVDTAEKVVDKVGDEAEELLDDAGDVVGDVKDTGEKLIKKLPFL